MAGFEDIADEAKARRREEAPGTQSPANEQIGADLTGTAATNADPDDPSTRDTDLTNGNWAAADAAGAVDPDAVHSGAVDIGEVEPGAEAAGDTGADV